MNWELRRCSRRGHITYAAIEPALRARLQADTATGAAWRCLRCGDFVVGPPGGGGPAADAPVVLRGRALREAVVLRVLAVERFVRALVLLSLGYGVLRFRDAQTSLAALYDRLVPAARPVAGVLDIDLGRSRTLAAVQSVLHSAPSRLGVVAALLAGYGALQVLEGVGLWSLQRWGEYVAVVGTSVFLPFEVYELTERITPVRAAAFAVNVALVGYLVVSKRLFGVRGGAEVARAHRRGSSLLEVEAAGS